MSGENMDKWLFQYRNLIETIDEFADEHGDEEFCCAWKYTKDMVTAHGLAIKPPNTPADEAMSIAWSQFEDTFDDNEEQGIVSLAGIIAHLVTSVPVGKSQEFHLALEVGFAKARGFSTEDAIAQHQEWLQKHGSIFDDDFMFTDNSKPFDQNPEQLRAQLRIVDNDE